MKLDVAVSARSSLRYLILMLRPTQSHDKGTKRTHSPDSFQPVKHIRSEIHPEDAWLLELHSKTWGCEASRQELFHEIELTASHYTELQKRLTENCPHRDSPSYEAEDVVSIKSDILLSFKPTQGPGVPLCHTEHKQHELDEDLEDGLDDELRSFFPFTIKYVDLSCLKSKFIRVPRLFLIRQEYDDISVLLEKLPKNDRGSATVSGQPGIGEIPI
jgi:hypothetical protein